MCNGKPHIYCFAEDLGETKLWGEFEANPLSNILKYFPVVNGETLKLLDGRC